MTARNTHPKRRCIDCRRKRTMRYPVCWGCSARRKESRR